MKATLSVMLTMLLLISLMGCGTSEATKAPRPESQAIVIGMYPIPVLVDRVSTTQEYDDDFIHVAYNSENESYYETSAGGHLAHVNPPKAAGFIGIDSSGMHWKVICDISQYNLGDSIEIFSGVLKPDNFLSVPAGPEVPESNKRRVHLAMLLDLQMNRGYVPLSYYEATMRHQYEWQEAK